MFLGMMIHQAQRDGYSVFAVISEQGPLAMGAALCRACDAKPPKGRPKVLTVLAICLAGQYPQRTCFAALPSKKAPSVETASLFTCSIKAAPGD